MGNNLKRFKKFLKNTRKQKNKLLDYVGSAILFYALFRFIKYITGSETIDIMLVFLATIFIYNLIYWISIFVIYYLEGKNNNDVK